ncbi:MAG: hypothetical protein WCF81_06825 [Roseiarcus sp.]
MHDVIDATRLDVAIEAQTGAAEGADVRRASFAQAAMLSRTDRPI